MIKDFFKDCEYRSKKGNVYFNSVTFDYSHPEISKRFEDGITNPNLRKNTIVFRHAITPKGRVSKWWCIVSFNGRTFPFGVSERRIVKKLAANTPKLPRGYQWSVPYLYSGKIVDEKDEVIV